MNFLPGGDHTPEVGRGKNFSSEVNFASVGPMAVQVIGLNGEDLGVGSLIGVVHRASNKGRYCTEASHVIAVSDPESPDGITELLSSECDYLPLTSRRLEAMTRDKSGQKPTSPISYLASLVEVSSAT